MCCPHSLSYIVTYSVKSTVAEPQRKQKAMAGLRLGQITGVMGRRSTPFLPLLWKTLRFRLQNGSAGKGACRPENLNSIPEPSTGMQ